MSRNTSRIAARLVAIWQKRATVTITFGECAENHVGMQKLGTKASKGFTPAELRQAADHLEKLGLKCEIVNLAIEEADTPEACVLVVRGFFNWLLEDERATETLLEELLWLEWDTKALMKRRVVNKIARYNVNFDDTAQEPDYEQGKGRVIPFSDIPMLQVAREMLPYFFGMKAAELKAEGNLYYDANKCLINYHGDTERRRVIALRFGQTLPLWYQWYHKGKAIGPRFKLEIPDGDCYLMSEKAVGTDWMCPSIPTLRHAAGTAEALGFDE